MRNSDANFACEPRSELILACFAKNAADRNFSNFAFYASEVLTLVRNANYAMRFTHVCTSLKQSFVSLKNWPLRPEVKAKVFLIVGPVQILTSHERFSFLEVVNLWIFKF